MAETNTSGLRKFLIAKGAAGYPLGETEQFADEAGDILEIFSRPPYQSFDRYAASADNRVISGRERVQKSGRQLWEMLYRQVLSPDADIEETYDVLTNQFWAEPDPNCPVGGQPDSSHDGYQYRLDSLAGPRNIGNFALEETITKDGSRIYVAHKIGGWTK